MKLKSPPRPPRFNPAPSRPAEIPAQFIEANRQLETNRFFTGRNHREIISQIEGKANQLENMEKKTILKVPIEGTLFRPINVENRAQKGSMKKTGHSCKGPSTVCV